MGQASQHKDMERLLAVAPERPPCFSSDGHWVEWLMSRQLAREMPLPLLARGGFNVDVRFCGDCNKAFKARMAGQGRCRPGWLQAPRTVPVRQVQGQKLVAWLDVEKDVRETNPLSTTERALLRRQEVLTLLLAKPRTAGQIRRELGLGKEETFALLLRLDAEQVIRAEQQSGGVVRWRRA